MPFAPAAAFAGEFPSNNLLLNTQSPEQHSRLSIPEGYSNGKEHYGKQHSHITASSPPQLQTDYFTIHSSITVCG